MKLNRLILGMAMFVAPFAHGQNTTNSNVNYVDPTIGSVGLILVPTRPTVHLPNSMVRVFPLRNDQLDDRMDGFPLTIASHRQESLFAMLPVSGEQPSGSRVWDREKTTPYYYSTVLDDADQVEFTPAARSGFFRVHFKGKEKHYLRFKALNGKGTFETQGKQVITGTEQFHGMAAYFYAEVNSSVSAKNENDVLLIEVPAETSLKYGVSFVSIEQAKINLQKEIPDWNFDAVKEKAFKAWDKVLGQINVKGGTEAQKRVFYTSLYRSYERMIDINEYGKYYSAYDHQVHTSDKPFYADNWLWDTYIALEPLQTMLHPGMAEDKINSYIQMYEQSGWMPSFAVVTGDMPCMTGNHAAAWMADAYFKGVKFDVKKAYEGLKKNSLQATLLPWRNGPATELDSFYNTHGYMPALYPGEKEWVSAVHNFERRQAVAVTLENSFDDWCIAQLAVPAGQPKDVPLFLKRAANYKNVYRADKGFMWPKDSAGKWIEPFDPKFSGGQGGRDYTTENNVYTYNWSVKHDLRGLFSLMGGRDSAEAKLDDLFRASLGRSKYQLWYTFPDATGLVGQFVMGNEPSFHIPYLYNYLGAPWKTQKRIRMLMDTWYTDNLFGIPGDEDGGGMTAFVVFSMMGFCPVTPGIPQYNIGSPVFTQVTIQLENGKVFTLNAPKNSADNKYIQKAAMNGKALDKPWFSHEDVLKGGVLELEMGEAPNKEWGSGEAAAPASSIDYKSMK